MRKKWLVLLFLLLSINGKTCNLQKNIGSLFCAPACPTRRESHRRDLLRLITQYHVRAFLIKKGTLAQVQELIFWLHQQSKDLFLIIDAEWGLGMTIQDAISYPKNSELAALQNKQLVQDIGCHIGKQCIEKGFFLNLAPVVDINYFDNSLLENRAFGDTSQVVSENAYAVAQGMKDAAAHICLKHFPNHGGVSKDSHLHLPVLNKSLQELLDLDWQPYIALKNLIDCVMVGHILLPQIDPIYPSSLSLKILNHLKELVGEGVLIISDALNMKALTDHYTIQEIATLAHTAGIDLLLYGDHIAPNIDKILKEDIPLAHQSISKMYEKGELNENALKEKVKKIHFLKKKDLP